MARQNRSAATRQKILDAATEVFGEVGYASASWGAIVERTGMTKGALYHHFDSKESLASALIEEGGETLLAAFRSVSGSASPALENMIHGTFAVVNVLSSDKLARVAEQLTAVLAGFNEAAGRFCVGWQQLIAAQAQRARVEGDLRQDLDPAEVGESVVGAMLGMRLLYNAIPVDSWSGNHIDRAGQVWKLMLPGIVADASLQYFREFLAREALRHASVDAPRRSAAVAVSGPEAIGPW